MSVNPATHDDRSMDVKVQLLMVELQAIQGGIQSMDSIMFKIKGWCITVAAAAIGLAINSNRPSLILVGIGITLAFWFVDAYFKAIQRVYIRRDIEIAKAFAGRDPIAVLSARLDEGGIWVPDLARRFQTPANSREQVYKLESKGTLDEATKPVVFLLYMPVALALIALYLVLKLS